MSSMHIILFWIIYIHIERAWANACVRIEAHSIGKHDWDLFDILMAPSLHTRYHWTNTHGTYIYVRYACPVRNRDYRLRHIFTLVFHSHTAFVLSYVLMCRRRQACLAFVCAIWSCTCLWWCMQIQFSVLPTNLKKINKSKRGSLWIKINSNSCE